MQQSLNLALEIIKKKLDFISNWRHLSFLFIEHLSFTQFLAQLLEIIFVQVALNKQTPSPRPKDFILNSGPVRFLWLVISIFTP